MSDELEAQQSQDEAEEAFAIEQAIKDAARKGREALWEMAEALYLFDETHAWMKLGRESLAEWLADPEVNLTMGTYRRYVRTWRKLVVEREIPATRLRELEQSKVAIVVDKIAANKVLVDEALADVEALGARDLREKYYDRRPSNVGQDGDNAATTPADASGQVDDLDEPVTADQLGGKQPIDASQVNIEIVSVPIEHLEEYGTPQPEHLHDDGTPREPEVVESTASEIEPDAIDMALAEAASAKIERGPSYEFPGWVTPGAVQKAIEDMTSAVDSGANFPRVSRSSCQLFLELANAWRETHGS